MKTIAEQNSEIYLKGRRASDAKWGAEFPAVAPASSLSRVERFKAAWAEVTGATAPQAARPVEKPAEKPAPEPGVQLAMAERMAQALRRLRSAKTGEASATVAADKLPRYVVEGGAR